MNRMLLLLFLIHWCLGNFFAQTTSAPLLVPSATEKAPDIVFTHLTEKDGLSYSFVTDMVQDRDGILWISTGFGLNRYDGNRVVVFKHNRKMPNTLLHNTITALTEDQEGNIWGSTENGMFCFDRVAKVFRNFQSIDRLKYPRLTTIVCDRNNQIWAGSEYGLVKLNQKTGTFEYLGYNERNPYSISGNRIKAKGILNDSKGEGLWIATSGGLNYFDFKTSKFTNHRNTAGSAVFTDHDVSALHQSREGMFWMFDEVTNDLIGFKEPSKGILHRISVNGAVQDAFGGTCFETSDHELWYSSASYETVCIKYLGQPKIEKIKHDNANSASIIGDWISSAWEDKDKTVWFGTSSGISKYNRNRAFYRTEKLYEQFPELDNNWEITCLTQNPTDQLCYAGTRHGKIYVLDPNSSQRSVIDLVKIAKVPLLSTFLTDIDFVDGQMIVCAAHGQTYQYDLRTKQLQLFKPLVGKYNTFRARTMSIESDSTYIIGNNGTGVLRWNFRDGTLAEISFKNTHTKEGYLYTCGWLKASKGKGTWLAATSTALGYIHPGSNVIQIFDLPIGMNINSGGFFSSLEVDQQGNCWFAYESLGLFQVKKLKDLPTRPQDIEVLHWDSSDGMVNEHIQSSVADSKGNIWLASANKFSVYNPRNRTFFNFKISQSESNSFYYNYLIPLQNGQMLTNIKGNLVFFYPEKIKSNAPQNDPVISTLELPSRKIFLNGSSKVTLEPDENFVTIAFGSLSDQEYYGYHFEYLLDGINSTWVTAGKDAVATYSNLWPGNYTFRVRAKSTDGAWSSAEKQIEIHIKAPFYKAWWFFLLVFIFLSGMTYFIVKSRLASLRKMNALVGKAQLLEKEKTVVMYENLKQHLNPHFLFNSLASLGSLIRLDPAQAGDFLEKMSKVYRYILKNKEQETVALGEELKFVGLYNQLQQTRFANGLKIEIDIPEAYHHRKIAPVTLQNLVENAIKHNIADEETPLIIRIFVKDDYLVVENTLQKKNFVETSNKQGQLSMVNLYQFLTSRPVLIQQTEKHYTISIPLI